jgi:hypothetical protein
VIERFSADWLALREPFDHVARNARLVRCLADLLPRRPRLLDLGGGTGSLFRSLAPVIGRGQDWFLIDADLGLLDEAFGCTAAWARRQGFAATASGDELLVSTPRGVWRLRPIACDLGQAEAMFGSTALQAAAVYSADAIICSALLDLVSGGWLERLCAMLTVPLLACLTVDGRDVWRPSHPFDAVVRTAYRGDMRRDKGFGPALGTAAPIALRQALAARGFAISSAPSDWCIPRGALRMQQALIDATADAARNARPAYASIIAIWQEARLRHALRGRLATTIGHRDILALPPGE